MTTPLIVSLIGLAFIGTILSIMAVLSFRALPPAERDYTNFVVPILCFATMIYILVK